VRGRGDENHPIEVIDAMTHDARNDAQRALYALLIGPKLCGEDPQRGARGRVEAPRITLEER
jgi:hypothetical protein